MKAELNKWKNQKYILHNKTEHFMQHQLRNNNKSVQHITLKIAINGQYENKATELYKGVPISTIFDFLQNSLDLW